MLMINPASLLADLQRQKGPKKTRDYPEMLSDWSKKALSRDHSSAALFNPVTSFQTLTRRVCRMSQPTKTPNLFAHLFLRHGEYMHVMHLMEACGGVYEPERAHIEGSQSAIRTCQSTIYTYPTQLTADLTFNE